MAGYETQPVGGEVQGSPNAGTFFQKAEKGFPLARRLAKALYRRSSWSGSQVANQHLRPRLLAWIECPAAMSSANGEERSAERRIENLQTVCMRLEPHLQRPVARCCTLSRCSAGDPRTNERWASRSACIPSTPTVPVAWCLRMYASPRTMPRCVRAVCVIGLGVDGSVVSDGKAAPNCADPRVSW